MIDLTERKRAEAELAHANRVATMGQLSASIAHEINQPIAAALLNAGNAVRWLARQPPNLEKTKQSIDRIINDGKRAADIMSRIRDFSKNAPARKEDLEINETILDIMRVTRGAMSGHSVLAKMQLSEGSGAASGEPRAHLRGLLHDQVERFGDGVVDLPLDRRCAWRAVMGNAERTSRRCFLHDAADRGKLA